VLLGDDTRGALDGVSSALAVAPRGYAHSDARLRRVGVGYDGSAESEHALELARAFADRDGAEVTVLQVVTFHEVGGHQPSAYEGWPVAIDREVDRCTERLAAIDGVSATVAYGAPGEELVALAKGLDLLIVGSRGYGPVRRLLHGSVSRYLVSHAPCPVLVLARASSTPDGHAPAAEGDAVIVGS
jgi:nucleotide-binding universal stress UspA family protein